MKFTYQIEGMHCNACIDKIKSALSNQVKIVEVTLTPPRLIIDQENPPSLFDLNKTLKSVGNYTLLENKSVDVNDKKSSLVTYYPLLLIIGYILLVVLINNFHPTFFSWQIAMNQFMAGFFLVFSAFKLLDLKGFADGYASYDLLAKRFYYYGYIYPFLELTLGILYLGFWFPTFTQIFTIILMGFSSIGVIQSLLKKQKIQCACLGTIIKVPLSTVTLIEDLTMVILALIGLFI